MTTSVQEHRVATQTIRQLNLAHVHNYRHNPAKPEPRKADISQPSFKTNDNRRPCRYAAPRSQKQQKFLQLTQPVSNTKKPAFLSLSCVCHFGGQRKTKSRFFLAPLLQNDKAKTAVILSIAKDLLLPVLSLAFQPPNARLAIPPPHPHVRKMSVALCSLAHKGPRYTRP
jgi:hypothetical protein